MGGFDVYSSALFPYINSLLLRGEKDKAVKLEKKFRDCGGFYSDGFPKWYLSHSIDDNGKDTFSVGDSDVHSCDFFQYICYELFKRQGVKFS